MNGDQNSRPWSHDLHMAALDLNHTDWNRRFNCRYSQDSQLPGFRTWWRTPRKYSATCATSEVGTTLTVEGDALTVIRPSSTDRQIFSKRPLLRYSSLYGHKSRWISSNSFVISPDRLSEIGHPWSSNAHFRTSISQEQEDRRSSWALGFRVPPSLSVNAVTLHCLNLEIPITLGNILASSRRFKGGFVRVAHERGPTMYAKVQRRPGSSIMQSFLASAWPCQMQKV